jgi:hypothetical protein
LSIKVKELDKIVGDRKLRRIISTKNRIALALAEKEIVPPEPAGLVDMTKGWIPWCIPDIS